MNIPGLQEHIQEHIAMGVPYKVLGTILTVGAGGQFSDLDTALSYRDTLGHTLLATFTGTITTSGSDDVRRIVADSGTPLSALVYLKGVVGIRVRGAGYPIVRGIIINSTTAQFLVPTQFTHTSVQVDIYEIIPYGISLLPGTICDLASGTRYIPAFTTITCPVKYGAMIRHSDTSAGNTFSARDDQNEIYFTNLILGDSTHKINSLFLSLPVNTNTNSPCEQTDFGIENCKCITASQDFIYAAGGKIHGAMHLKDNIITGTYDIVSPGLFRYLDVSNNEFHIASEGDYSGGTGDSGSPTGIPIGSNGTSFTYLHQVYSIQGNMFDLQGRIRVDTGPVIAGVDIRQALPSASVVTVTGNMFKLRADSGTETEGCVAVKVGANVTGSNTPTIFVKGNIFDVVNLGSGAAKTMDSANATYVIKHADNVVIAGVLGANTTYYHAGSGTATVTAAATSVTVTHGLGYTPNIQDITITPTLLSLSKSWWITAIGGTTFQINVDVVPGAGTATFAWRVG